MYTYYRQFKIEADKVNDKVIYRVKLASCPFLFWERVEKGKLPQVIYNIKEKIDKLIYEDDGYFNY